MVFEFLQFALIGSVLESTKGGATFYLSAGPNLTFCRCNKFRRDFKSLHLNSGTPWFFQQSFGKNVQNPKLSWSETFLVRGCVVRGWVFHCRLDLRFPKIIPQLRVKNEIAILTSVFGYNCTTYIMNMSTRFAHGKGEVEFFSRFFEWK